MSCIKVLLFLNIWSRANI